MHILQEILQSPPFLMSRHFKTQGYRWFEVKRNKCILQIKGVVEQGLRYLFVFSSTY